MPFLSVVIAAHNSEATLDATLQSLLSAMGGAESIEVIILNDGSTDATQQIIEQWRSRFANFKSEQVAFRNVGKVRNYALSLASGQYITMLDSDDLLKPGSLRDAMDFLREQQPDMLLTHLIEIRDLSKITPEWSGFAPEQIGTQEAIRRFLVHKDFQAHLIGQFIHRDIYKKAPIPTMVCYEDFAIFPTLLVESRKIWFQRSGHYYYVKRPASLSNALDSTKIGHLVECTLNMEQVFPASFQSLILCHWFDIYSNHQSRLTDDQRDLVKARVDRMYSLPFFLAKDVRFSYKKRAIKALLKR